MSDFYDPNLQALDQIEDLLEAYADVRLAPRGPVLRRMRATVIAQAAANAAVQRRLAVADRPKPARWALPHLQVPRRAFALGLAAALTLGTSAAVLAAPPGSPFFNARVMIETALLPSQSDARLASHEQHLDEWLAAAEEAAARGDVAALEAALAAYQAEVGNVVGDIGDDAARLAHLQEVLAKHVAKLEALAARLTNETASDNAVEHAIAANEKAVKKLQDKEKANGGVRPTPKPDNARPTPNAAGGNPDGRADNQQGGN